MPHAPHSTSSSGVDTQKNLSAVFLFASFFMASFLNASIYWNIFWGFVLFCTLSSLAQALTRKRSKRLTRKITVVQVEIEHPEIHENQKWRGLLGKLREGDALWKFVNPAQQGSAPCNVGIAIVRAGIIAEWILVTKGKRMKIGNWICGCCTRMPSNRWRTTGNVRRSHFPPVRDA